MSESDPQSSLRDNLLALPLWARLSAFGLLVVGVGVGFTLLLAPNLSTALRTAGGQLLIISLPVLAVAIGLLGASWSRTEQIDSMVARFLRETVGDKLEAYLLPPGQARTHAHFPPLFDRMERHFSDEITSFCHYHLFDDRGNRRFDLMVKSNVFNIEFSFVLLLVSPPEGWTNDMSGRSYIFRSVDDWAEASANPLASLASDSVFGSLSEGYTVMVNADVDADDALRVRFRLRQKRHDNFLTSPYLRRYFAEDIALAMYYIYREVFTKSADNVLDGRF